MLEVEAMREAVADRGVVGALIDKQVVLFSIIRHPVYQPFQPANSQPGTTRSLTHLHLIIQQSGCKCLDGF